MIFYFIKLTLTINDWNKIILLNKIRIYIYKDKPKYYGLITYKVEGFEFHLRNSLNVISKCTLNII